MVPRMRIFLAERSTLRHFGHLLSAVSPRKLHLKHSLYSAGDNACCCCIVSVTEIDNQSTWIFKLGHTKGPFRVQADREKAVALEPLDLLHLIENFHSSGSHGHPEICVFRFDVRIGKRLKIDRNEEAAANANLSLSGIFECGSWFELDLIVRNSF